MKRRFSHTVEEQIGGQLQAGLVFFSRLQRADTCYSLSDTDAGTLQDACHNLPLTYTAQQSLCSDYLPDLLYMDSGRAVQIFL